MHTPPRPLLALALAVALVAGAVPLLPSGPRPTVASVVAPFAPTASAPVAPGVRHDDGAMTTTAGSQDIHLVEIDPATPGIVFHASLSNDHIAGLETVSAQAARQSAEGHRVVAAINGDVWAGTANDLERAPNGIHIEDGELMAAASSARPTFGIDASGRPMLGSVDTDIVLTNADGARFTIARVNSLRRSGELALYTPRFGSRTSTAATGVDVVIAGVTLPLTTTGTWTGTVAEVRTAGSYPIADGTFVLTGPSTSSIRFLTPGEPVSIQTSITPGWETASQAVGGREWIVQNGAPYIYPVSDTVTQRHPRSAIGITGDGKVIMAAADGRQSDSDGLTLAELADFMIAHGAVSAINLDGGGSSTLVARQPGDLNASVINEPSGGAQRAVTNSIQVISLIPTGPLSQLTLRPGSATIYERTSLSLQAIGQDAAYNPVPVADSPVSWSVDSAIGTVDPSGRFTASTAGSGTIRATAGGVQGQATITVLADTTPPTVPAPTVAFPSDGRLTSTVPITVRWDAGQDVGSGLAGYQLQTSTGGGAWADVPLASAGTRTVALRLLRDTTYEFQARALDVAGNASAWMPSGAFHVLVLPETAGSISYHGHWDKLRSVNYDGGVARSTAVAGAWARMGFTSSAVAWVVARRPDRGTARVLVDGEDAGTVSLAAAKPRSGVMLVTRSWPTAGRHTLEIRNLGTKGRPRIDIDGYIILQPVAGSAPPPMANQTPAPPSTPVPTPAPPAPTPAPTPAPGAASSAEAVLVGAGDIASCGLDEDGQTASVVSAIDGTVFTAGDNAYESGTPSEFRDCYGPTWGTLLSRTRPAPGNHDYVTSGASGYFGYFGARAGTAGQGWYAYDLGAWRIYSLNSNCADVGCGAGSAQEQWLKADLAANPRQCVAAIWHHPEFSSGQHGNSTAMRAVWDDLYAADADVVINGHDHDYERFAPQTPAGAASAARGIREFVVGTGGAAIRPFATVRANSQVRNAATHGVLKLTLRSGAYGWEFLPAGSGTFRDSGQANCH
ncbi:MAG TPA: phosphodiester glycosidase family protein [Candidatus Limnocylindrales bacterium]